MSKIKPIAVFLTDTHLKKDNLDLVYNIFKQAIELAENLGVDKVYHGGDFFTNRIAQNLQTLLTFSKILKLFKKRGIELIGIPGNHDKTNQNSEDSYLDIFYNYSNFTIVRDVHVEVEKDVSIGFLPYFTGSYLERLKKLKSQTKRLKTGKNILITHKAFNGVRNNDGSLVEDGVRVKDVSFWDTVMVGHYHDASELGKNIIYTGSAYQSNYGENIEDKGFTVIMSDGSLEFEQSVFPKYVKVKLDISDDIESEIEMHDVETNNVRFVFTGDKSDISKVDRSKLDELGIDCKFELNDVNEEILKVEQGDFSVMSRKTIVKHFSDYCNIQEIPKKMKSKGLKVLMR